jgi:hypothetical protein
MLPRICIEPIIQRLLGRCQLNVEATGAGRRLCNPGDEIPQDGVVLGDAEFTDIAGTMLETL